MKRAAEDLVDKLDDDVRAQRRALTPPHLHHHTMGIRGGTSAFSRKGDIAGRAGVVTHPAAVMDVPPLIWLDWPAV